MNKQLIATALTDDQDETSYGTTAAALSTLNDLQAPTVEVVDDPSNEAPQLGIEETVVLKEEIETQHSERFIDSLQGMGTGASTSVRQQVMDEARLKHLKATAVSRHMQNKKRKKILRRYKKMIKNRNH